jgi:hypothetical protein
MTTKALFVKLETKSGKENEVAKFLRDGQGLVQQEPATTAWFGIRFGPTAFAIFDAFPDDAGRDWLRARDSARSAERASFARFGEMRPSTQGQDRVAHKGLKRSCVPGFPDPVTLTPSPNLQSSSTEQAAAQFSTTPWRFVASRLETLKR